MNSNGFSACVLPRYEDVVNTHLTTPDTPLALPQPYTLVPALASHSTRYGREYHVETSKLKLPAGPLRKQNNQFPSEWTQDVHPEGNPIFSNPALHLVTDDDIRDPCTRLQLEMCATRVRLLIKESQLELPSQWHICASLDADSETCRYYVVDHDSRLIFWPGEVDTEEVGLPDAASQDHMRHAISEEYYLHAESFPHNIPRISEMTEELAKILTFGRADQLTSDSSTFPYDAAVCEQYLGLIRSSKHEGAEWTWYISRIWTSIARHRFDTFHGEVYARISREQRRLGPRDVKTGLISRAVDLALFRAPARIASELESLHVDSIVYTIHWRRFIKARLADWRESAIGTLAILIATLIALIYTNSASAQWIGLMGALFAVGGLLANALLHQRYTGAHELHAVDVTDHVRNLDHQTQGYQPSGALFAVPRAMQTYSLILLFAQLTVTGYSPGPLTPVTAVIATALGFTATAYAAYATVTRFVKFARGIACPKGAVQLCSDMSPA